MIETILEQIAHWTIVLIESTGEIGIFLLMLLESANIPIPSEVTMPFAGFLASSGKFSFWIVVLVGALGNLVGSLISYWIGLKGGRPFLERHGKYFFVNIKDLEKGDRAFKNHGLKIAFWSRLLPVVRTFISLPAGINRASLKGFALYTFLGSFIWSALLAYVGFWAGENWQFLHPIFEKLSFLILSLLVLVVVIYTWRHLKNGKDSYSKLEE